MKTQLFTEFNNDHSVKAENNTKEVDTTVHNSQPKSFSAAELWNIQRRHVTITQRRRFA